jgi:bidirectional [NiFe] hydrogenase diaphorase subunit
MTTPIKDSTLRRLQAQQLQARKFQTRKQRSLQTLELLEKEEQEKKARKLIEKQKQESFAKDQRYRALDNVLRKRNNSQDAVIEVLHHAQSSFGYLDDEVLTYVARAVKLPLSRVYGVATFYHLFSLKPQGEHNCVVCLGTACYVKGGDKILSALEKLLDIQNGETTPDGKISLLTARCMGACGIAPAVIIDNEVAGKQDVDSVLGAIKELINNS